MVTFGHPQDVQLCYGPSSTYAPVGSLDPATSLEAPGPGFPAYPTEDFPGQVRGREITGVPTICPWRLLGARRGLPPSDEPPRLRAVSAASHGPAGRRTGSVAVTCVSQVSVGVVWVSPDPAMEVRAQPGCGL